MDFMSIVVNAVQMILSIIVWYPFFKMYDNELLAEEKEAQQNREEGFFLFLFIFNNV